MTSKDEIMSEYKTEDGKIILFKQFDDRQKEYDEELDAKKLAAFVTVNSLPLIVDFNQETAQKIFGGEIKSHLLIFLSKEAGHFEKYVENFKEPAKKFLGKVLFVTLNTDDADHGRILEFFGMSSSELPDMRIITMDKDMQKYKPKSSELSAENVNEFVSDFLEGKLKRHLLTEDLPEDWDKKPVKVLTGVNFHEVAYDDNKNVLVEFYAPWCTHCKQLVPIYDQLGEKFNDKEDIVIAKMDATTNELEDVKIVSFPTIYLFKKGTKTVNWNFLFLLFHIFVTFESSILVCLFQPVEFTGARTLEELTKFVESNGASQDVPEEVKIEKYN